MNSEINLIKNQSKDNIQKLINSGDLKDAKDDVEVYSMATVMSIIERKLDKTETLLNQRMNIEQYNFDLNYNLGYVYEQKNNFNMALNYYNRAKDNGSDKDLKDKVDGMVNKIKTEHPQLINKDRPKLVFFVKQGMDSFLGDIINGLADEYIARKIVVTDYKQIDEGMKWADICWFEWCDELVIYGSKLPLAREKKIICRLHSYEAFTSYPNNVQWDNVDLLIFVADHIKQFITDKFKMYNKNMVVIPNGIDISNWTFKYRKPGYNIAYVGYINYKKGPMLLLHTFKAIYDKDHKYKLYIAGQFQDDRDVLYFRQMIKEFNFEKNVIFNGWQDNLDKWLEDKNYILCTSILESQNMSVMQAMAKGIKPLVHNFVGAKTIYPKAHVWNTIDEAVDMISQNNYESKEYKKFIEESYLLKGQVEKIKLNVKKLVDRTNIDVFKKEKKPVVTVGITNYNGKQYLECCIESVLRQSYDNVKILLIDDCSKDGSKEIIQSYEKNYKNIKAIYHEQNSGGASRGIEEIIENSEGKYFQWIACDDFLKGNAIECFVNYLEQNQQKDYVYSDLNIVNENNMCTGKWAYNVLSKNEVVQHIFNTGSGIIPMNCLYRKSFFIKNKVKWIIYRGNDFSADTLNSLNFIKNNWSYGKVDDAVINYRIHSNNASHNLDKRIKNSVSLFDYVIKNFSEEIYFPQICWKDIKDRIQFKNYIIAKYYYEQFNNNLSGNVIPGYLNVSVTKEELIAYCQAFLKEGMKYINEGLNQGDTYKVEINKLKNEYESCMK